MVYDPKWQLESFDMYVPWGPGSQLCQLNRLNEALLGIWSNPNWFLIRQHLQKEDGILLLTREACVGDFVRGQFRDLLDESPVQAVPGRLGGDVGQSPGFAA